MSIKHVSGPGAAVALENPGFPRRSGFDAWKQNGDLLIRTDVEGAMWKRKPSYFRNNATGRVFVVYSKYKTEELSAAMIQWRAKVATMRPVRSRRQLRLEADKGEPPNERDTTNGNIHL